MSKLLKLSLLSVALVACELQPSPPKQAPPPAASPPAPTAPSPAPAGPSDAGAAQAADDAGPQWSDDCKNVGIHIADVIVSTTVDVAQKAIFDRDREKMVRSIADVCMHQHWSDVAIRCYMGSRTQPDMKTCEKKYTPVPTPPPQPKIDENGARPGQAAGSGSATANGGAAAAGKGSGSAKPR